MSFPINAGDTLVVSGAVGLYVNGPVTGFTGNISGGNVNVVSGAVRLRGWFTELTSGAQASYSGVQIRIAHATSGMFAQLSGTPLAGIDFGAHSGLDTGNVAAFKRAFPDHFDINILCRSGIVVATSGVGFRLTVFYDQRIT